LEKFNQLFIPASSQSRGQGEKDSNSNVIKNIGTIILSIIAVVLAMILVIILIKYKQNPTVTKITESLK
jgi:peptidoglycan biosynthesis protein MviN/MurJ (putative lipid II flippase)